MEHRGGEIEVRDARPEEYQALGELTVAAFSEYRGGTSDAAWEPYITDLRDVPGRARVARTLVAVDGGELVGVVALFPPGSAEVHELPPTAGYIRALAASPASRRRGIGRALTQACVDAAREAGWESIGLMTHERMAAARALYDALGFTVVARLTWEPYGNFLAYLLPLG